MTPPSESLRGAAVTPYIFVVRGDLTRIQADAIVYSTSTQPRETGDLTRAMRANVPGFGDEYERRMRPMELGDVDWIPLGESRARLRGVLVAATVERTVAGEAIERVVERAIELAYDKLAGATGHDRILVAFPSLGTGTNGTGRHKAPALARVQIRALARALANPRYEGRVDAVVVAYSKSAYRRFIEARTTLRERYAWLRPPTAMAEAQSLVEAIQRRECVLFVGSGLSIGAGLPSWSELVARLIGDVPGLRDFLRERARNRFPPDVAEDLDDDWVPPLTLDDFLDLAQWHAQTPHEGESHQHYIHELFGGREQTYPPTLAHYLLLSLPFHTIVTTNYDNLIEDTLDALRKARVRVVFDDEVPLTGDSTAVAVVKLHGHASSTGDPRYDEAIVLTRDEYDQFFERHPAKARLLEGLLLSHHFCFYGYSLSDPDLRQIYNRAARTLRSTKRLAFSISPFEASVWSRRQWADKGLHQIGFQPHHTRGDELRQLMLWLDGLAEHAAERDQTFLANPERAPRARMALQPVHDALRELGKTVEHLRAEDLGEADVEVLAPVLDLLEHLGWTPRETAQAHIWEAFADAVLASGPPTRERVHQARRLLYRAFGAAHRLELLEEAKERLAKLDAIDHS